MPWFKSLRSAFINNREVRPGELVQYSGQPGKWLQPMSADDLKKDRAAVDAATPPKPVEQRLDDIELTLGRDNIAKAIERKAAEEARRAAAEKAAADKAAKAASDKAAADAAAQDKVDAKAEAATAKADAKAEAAAGA